MQLKVLIYEYFATGTYLYTMPHNNNNNNCVNKDYMALEAKRASANIFISVGLRGYFGRCSLMVSR